jgi:hypothetical protein
VLEASDSDSEDGEDPNNASADEQSTIENSADIPSGYIHDHLHVTSLDLI